MTVRLPATVLVLVIALAAVACSQRARETGAGTGAAAPSQNASITGMGISRQVACLPPVLSTLAPSKLKMARARAAVSVSPGQLLRVYGYGYIDCVDVNRNFQPPASPFWDLTVFVVQGQRRLALATVSAHRPGGTFYVSIRLPANLRPGPAIIQTSGSQPGGRPLRIQVR